MNAREIALHALVLRRKSTRWDGFNCIGDYHNGEYECDFVSPYTKGAHNADSDIFVLLQDWSSDERLKGPIDVNASKIGMSPELPTNKKLQELLGAHFGVSLGDVYATNLFPFIKLGRLSDKIPTSALVRAAKDFAIPQIEIISPSLVICLGISTFNAIRRGCDLSPLANVESALQQPFIVGEKSVVWCQAHTGALGQNNRNRGGVNRVNDDWLRMKTAYIDAPSR